MIIAALSTHLKVIKVFFQPHLSFIVMKHWSTGLFVRPAMSFLVWTSSCVLWSLSSSSTCELCLWHWILSQQGRPDTLTQTAALSFSTELSLCLLGVSESLPRHVGLVNLRAALMELLFLVSAGVSVFGAFLRSEYSEENLQFYLACEQYSHSSNNFSLQRRAKDISATYIQSGSPREVKHWNCCFFTSSADSAWFLYEPTGVVKVLLTVFFRGAWFKPSICVKLWQYKVVLSSDCWQSN